MSDSSSTLRARGIISGSEVLTRLNALAQRAIDDGDGARAVQAYKLGLSLLNATAEDYAALGRLLENRYGLQDAARAMYQAAIAIAPSDAVLRSLAYLMDQYTAMDPHAAATSLRTWMDAMYRPVRHHIGEPIDDPGPLVLGVVSSDFFSDHSLSRVFSWMTRLAPRFTVIVYHVLPLDGAERVGTVTLRDVSGQSPQRIAEAMKADGVHIGLDLVSYAIPYFLGIFEHRPCPVQMTSIATGTSSLRRSYDYILTDAWFSPPGSEALYTEKLVRLPRFGFTVDPPHAAPPATTPPCFQRGQVTFGSFNRIVKHTDVSFALWAEILHAVPGARLLIKGLNFDIPANRNRVLATLQRHGINGDRIDLMGQTGMAEHLARMGDVDIALETVPQSGGISTFDCLWMGVPCVAWLHDERPSSRTAANYACRAGLAGLVAHSREEYVATAVTLARNPDALALLRPVLRQRLQASGLCDAEALAKAMEFAFDLIWRRHAQGLPVEHISLDP